MWYHSFRRNCSPRPWLSMPTHTSFRCHRSLARFWLSPSDRSGRESPCRIWQNFWCAEWSSRPSPELGFRRVIPFWNHNSETLCLHASPEKSTISVGRHGSINKASTRRAKRRNSNGRRGKNSQLNQQITIVTGVILRTASFVYSNWRVVWWGAPAPRGPVTLTRALIVRGWPRASSKDRAMMGKRARTTMRKTNDGVACSRPLSWLDATPKTFDKWFLLLGHVRKDNCVLGHGKRFDGEKGEGTKIGKLLEAPRGSAQNARHVKQNSSNISAVTCLLLKQMISVIIVLYNNTAEVIRTKIREAKCTVGRWLHVGHIIMIFCSSAVWKHDLLNTLSGKKKGERTGVW